MFLLCILFFIFSNSAQSRNFSFVFLLFGFLFCFFLIFLTRLYLIHHQTHFISAPIFRLDFSHYQTHFISPLVFRLDFSCFFTCFSWPTIRQACSTVRSHSIVLFFFFFHSSSPSPQNNSFMDFLSCPLITTQLSSCLAPCPIPFFLIFFFSLTHLARRQLDPLHRVPQETIAQLLVNLRYKKNI